jgi:hypothetical protein
VRNYFLRDSEGARDGKENTCSCLSDQFFSPFRADVFIAKALLCSALSRARSLPIAPD